MVEERRANMRAKRQLAKVGLNETSIKSFLKEVVDEDLHAKTVMSVSLATLGALHAGSLCIHVIGGRWQGRVEQIPNTLPSR